MRRPRSPCADSPSPESVRKMVAVARGDVPVRRPARLFCPVASPPCTPSELELELGRVVELETCRKALHAQVEVMSSPTPESLERARQLRLMFQGVQAAEGRGYAAAGGSRCSPWTPELLALRITGAPDLHGLAMAVYEAVFLMCTDEMDPLAYWAVCGASLSLAAALRLLTLFADTLLGLRPLVGALSARRSLWNMPPRTRSLLMMTVWALDYAVPGLRLPVDVKLLVFAHVATNEYHDELRKAGLAVVRSAAYLERFWIPNQRSAAGNASLFLWGDRLVEMALFGRLLPGPSTLPRAFRLPRHF